jgi:hypothetical protein
MEFMGLKERRYWTLVQWGRSGLRRSNPKSFGKMDEVNIPEAVALAKEVVAVNGTDFWP